MQAVALIWTEQMEESWQIEIRLKIARKLVRLDNYDRIGNTWPFCHIVESLRLTFLFGLLHIFSAKKKKSLPATTLFLWLEKRTLRIVLT